MILLSIVLGSALLLMAAYKTYGSILSRWLRLDAARPMPSETMRDDVDYVPTEPGFLLSQHFSAIAAAGPIVGPILAGIYFGWLPALAWILVGCVFIGGVHDFTALVASVRHKARSVAHLVREHMSRRAYILFLLFIYVALIYIIVAFTDIVASSFVGDKKLEDGVTTISGGATATSSLLYLALPILMGLLLKFTKIGITRATAIFLPLIAVAIWVGPMMPLNIERWMPGATVAQMDAAEREARVNVVAQAATKTARANPGTDDAAIAATVDAVLADVAKTSDQAAAAARAAADYEIRRANAVKAWDVALLLYCLVAGALPMWLLLQPRGHLGGYFLYVALGGAVLGLLVGAMRGMLGGDPQALAIRYPAFVGWSSAKGGSLVPMLFITIACGACSGFHCLIASGTTSKQLRNEADAKPIGYGAMLLEGFVAVISLTCVMLLDQGGDVATKSGPNHIYALGNSTYLAALGVARGFGIAFALLAFTTFVYDTLDVCTRLGRYIIQELTGWQGAAGRWFAAGVTSLLPLFFVTMKVTNAQGKPIAAWQLYWSLFGASNQLLAALALLGIFVWLWRTYRAKWVWFAVGLPTVFMYTMSTWALTQMIRDGLVVDGKWSASPVPYTACVLLLLAVLMVAEAARVFLGGSPPQPTGTDLAPAPA